MSILAAGEVDMKEPSCSSRLRVNMLIQENKALLQLRLNPIVFGLKYSYIKEYTLAAAVSSGLTLSKKVYPFSVLKKNYKGNFYAWKAETLERRYGGSPITLWRNRSYRGELFE